MWCITFLVPLAIRVYAEAASGDRIRELYTIDGQPRLRDQVREQILSRHYSIRTERVYCKWVTPHGRNRSAEVKASHADFAVYGCVFTSTQY